MGANAFRDGWEWGQHMWGRLRMVVDVYLHTANCSTSMYDNNKFVHLGNVFVQWCKYIL